MTNAAHNQSKRIEAYSIAEFVQQVQQAIREGYELDLNTNENYPQQFGTLFTCGVVKAGDVIVVNVALTEPAQDSEVITLAPKRGRKPSNTNS